MLTSSPKRPVFCCVRALLDGAAPIFVIKQHNRGIVMSRRPEINNKAKQSGHCYIAAARDLRGGCIFGPCSPLNGPKECCLAVVRALI